MTLKTPAHMVVVKKEDKEEKLRHLLREALADLSDETTPILRVLVRSANSPVMAVLASLQSDLVIARVECRVIVGLVEGPCMALGADCTRRLLADLRCHDAHEMLILSPSTTWIGDMMRREPSSRDSFEMHARGSRQTATDNATSFDRFWALSRQLAKPMSAARSMGDSMALAGQLAGLPGDAANTSQALTRH